MKHIWATFPVLAVLVTAAAVGSGLVGGVFAPALFIGAAVGASIGTLAQAAGLVFRV